MILSCAKSLNYEWPESPFGLIISRSTLSDVPNVHGTSTAICIINDMNIDTIECELAD